MTKRNKIIYWISTLWLALGMTATGIGQLLKMKEGSGAVNSITHLGYPTYILTLLGICKILGVIAVLIPKFPLLKEWAYAGLSFVIFGAIYSHVASGDSAKEFFGPVLLLALIGLSWYFRPDDRKVILANFNK